MKKSILTYSRDAFVAMYARIVHARAVSSLLIIAVLMASLFTGSVSAQETDEEYEEIAVFLAVQGIGGYEINAVYQNEYLYLPVADMFRNLKINHRISEYNDTISGFFLNESNAYIISQLNRTVFVNGKLIQLAENELISTENTSMALRIDMYGKLFGLDCHFNFNSLTVELKTSHELPILKELRLSQMRKNISRLKGEIQVDTTYKRDYHMLRGTMIDWAVYSTQVIGKSSETRAMLGLGTELFGGETNLELNYSTSNGFDPRQQQYQWRWANNDTRFIKQIKAGKLYSRSISSIYSPMVGASITNTPTTYRRSFGSYTMTDFTEPGWTVELYINNVIVDYTTADASGFFKFDIPLVYGSSSVLLKFLGPWGEERQREQNIVIPYNFLPKGEFQYNIAGAMIQDTSHGIFSRAEANYGVNRHISVGGGFEYLSTIKANPSIPFVNGSAQFLTNFLVNAEYAHGVRAKGLISYSLPSSFVFDIDYTKYVEEQKAITFNYLEERKIRVSIPISINKFKAYTRVAFVQNILKETVFNTTEATFSTYFGGVNANFTGNANWLKDKDPYIYGNLTLGFRLFRTLAVRPQIQYDFSGNSMIFTKLELENNFSPKSNLILSWENNIRNSVHTLELTFRYDLPFAQTSLNTRISKNFTMTGQSARGSLAFGSGNAKVLADRRNQVGRAGITLVPYLDINNNNKRDENERITYGLDLRINGGRILQGKNDSIFRILDLEPFASYMLELNDTKFENIAWQLTNKTMSILMDPNQFKLIEIPIKVMGEINGMVYLRSGNKLKPQSRVVVNIYNSAGNLVAKTLSESDGYYNYLGLVPGKYTARVDSEQLQRLKSTCKPDYFEFEINPSEYGDIIDNVEFTLTKLQIDTSDNIKKVQPEPAQPKTVVVPVVETKPQVPAVSNDIPVKQKQEPLNLAKTATESHKFFIQAGAFEDKQNAIDLMAELRMLTGEDWFYIEEDGYFKVRLGYFDSRQAARSYANTLNTPGIYYYINKVKAGTPAAKTPDFAPKTEVKPVVTPPTQVKAEKVTPVKQSPNYDILSDSLGYFVQAGAFEYKSNADDLLEELLKITPNKWFVVFERGFHKVRLGYFKTKDEAKLVEASLNIPDMEYYVNGKQSYDKYTPAISDGKTTGTTDTKPAKTSLPEYLAYKPQSANSGNENLNNNKGKSASELQSAKAEEKLKYYIQAGAFQTKEKAEKLSNELFDITLKRWFIVNEENMFKVRLGYFETREAATFIKNTLSAPEVFFYVGEKETVIPIY